MERGERRRDIENKPQSVLRVLLQRHGPKLSATGEKDARAEYFDDSVIERFGAMDIPEGEGLVRISTSPLPRAVATAELELEELATSDHRGKDKAIVRKQLETFRPDDESKSHDLEIIVKLQKELEPEIRTAVEHELTSRPPQEQEAEIRNRIDQQILGDLFNDNKRRSLGIEMSYEDLANNLAERYRGFLRHAGGLEKQRTEGGKQPIEEPYVEVDVSHSYPIMSFLKKYLVFDDGTRADSLPSQEFFDRVGGVVGESDSIQMDYVQDGLGKYTIQIQGNYKKLFSGKIIFE